MHEMSLAESVIQIIEDAADAQRFSRVRTVWLEVGSMAGVEQDALRFCFDAVARDTVAHEAKLEIVTVPGSGQCTECGSTHPANDLLELCPRCGSAAVTVTGGNQMRVKELDVL